QGAGARYPYPKEVWSPAGGWWSRPSNWKSNTAISFAMILAITYAVGSLGAEKETRYVQPSQPIPSMRWAAQYRNKDKKQDE
ncbi:hypothetical protein OBBRIDRAFT_731260, partial [Obba rivulosa]